MNDVLLTSLCFTCMRSHTCVSLVVDEGNNGLQNFFIEPIAAGKAGAEKRAATRLILKIHDIISSSLLHKHIKNSIKKTDYVACFTKVKAGVEMWCSRGLQEEDPPVRRLQFKDVRSLAVVAGSRGHSVMNPNCVLQIHLWQIFIRLILILTTRGR